MQLTEANIATAQPGDVLRDSTINGLHLRCFPTRKSFYLYFRTKTGRERRPKLGDYGSITLAQARKAAREKLAIVAAGRDPEAELEAEAAEHTLSDLWDEYWKRHGAAKKSGKEDRRKWDTILAKRLGSIRLREIDFAKVDDLHRALRSTPVEANRTLALLSKMFSFAVRPLGWPEVATNPCQGVTRYKETKRKRYMRPANEAPAIAEALRREADANPAAVAFLYLLILTGARKGEIAKAKWADLRGDKLVLSEHKTDGGGEDRVIHLPPAAMAVIGKLPRTLGGTITGIKDPKKLWEKVRVAAGCPDLRIHDLRHSFASAALASGKTLAQVGELLGHSSPQTTKRYAHLVDEAAARAAADAADVMSEWMKIG